jgi:Zn-dependent peptidase ImmA (M78 family)/predicted secreted protein
MALNAHLVAAREALEAHRELGSDLSQRVDPFAALATAGVIVLRRPLGRLAGAYIAANPQEGSAPGVLIHAGHPLSKQRYTAAHELCHHRRDRTTVLDEETEWLARGEDRLSERERIAEAFAAWFLMPEQLMATTIARLGIAIDHLDASQAYTLSLELGTSYEATLHHLVDLQLLSRPRRDQLLLVKPKAIKEQLGERDSLADARKNIWLVNTLDGTRVLRPLVGDAVVVTVPETPSTGYLWQPTVIPQTLTLTRDEFTAPDSVSIGGRGQHRFLVRVKGVGSQQLPADLRLEMRRPWERSKPAESLNVLVHAEPQPRTGIVQPDQLLAIGA